MASRIARADARRCPSHTGRTVDRMDKDRQIAAHRRCGAIDQTCAAPFAADEMHDVTIIGSGPAGLFAAFYAGLRDMRIAILETLPLAGGQLSTLYPAKNIYDVGGFPAVRARRLVRRLVLQTRPFEPKVRLGERALELDRLPDGSFIVKTDRGELKTRSVIVAAGIGAFEPIRLNAIGVEEYDGKGVSYTAPDPAQYRGKRCLVVGGGNSAIDYAMMLAPGAQELTLVHRRDVFRAHEYSVGRLTKLGARIWPFWELREVVGDGSKVTAAVVFDNRSGEEKRMEIDQVLIGLGFKSKLGPLAKWGFSLKANKIQTSDRMETAIPGVYACGDVTTYDGKLDLIATAFGEASIAANEAKHYVSPKAKVFPGHSSEREGQ